MKKYCLLFTVCCLLFGCAGYQTPPRDEWSSVLRGASFGDMTSDAKIAKRPIFMGTGGVPIESAAVARPMMEQLEYELYDALRKPGIQVQRVGTDVVVVLVRDAFMSVDQPDISADGADTLRIISKILVKYGNTYIEIAGYTDAMRDANMAKSFSLDMAQRVALFFAAHEIHPVRMFIVGRGSARPISDQSTTGRLMNRRVELRISPVIR
ncbi:MAG: OmpA family protein [Alphaproteobacteria bacterium]|nr:OmpA family protein [Alphaproteobacteria bacterium]